MHALFVSIFLGDFASTPHLVFALRWLKEIQDDPLELPQVCLEMLFLLGPRLRPPSPSITFYRI